MTTIDIYKTYREAVGGLKTSAQKERARVKREANIQRGKISEQRERLKGELKSVLDELETARQLEMRKRGLVFTKPSRKLLAQIEANKVSAKEQADKYEAELQDLEKQVATAETGVMKNLKEQIEDKQTEINDWKDKADKEYKKWEAKVKAQKAEVKAIEQKLKPFEVKDGYDLVKALEEGITEKFLLEVGFLQKDINDIKAFRVEQVATAKKLAPFKSTYATAGEAYKAGAITLSQLSAYKSAELFPTKYKVAYTPLSTYDLSAALKADISEDFLIKVGFDKKSITEIKAYDKALTSLKPYIDKKGQIDITKALRDKVITTKDLKIVGIGDKAIKQAEHYSKIGKVRGFWEGMTPWEEWKGEKATTKGVGEMVAVMLVPGVWAKDWHELDNKWRAINIAIDIAVLIPFTGWIARGAKIGVVGLRTFMVSSKALRATAKTAKVAGEAHEALSAGLKVFQRMRMGEKGYAKVASDVQHFAYASMKADKAFADSVMKLTRITPKQLVKLENLSRMGGLKESILDVGKAQKELSNAWDVLGKFKVGTRPYIQQLTKVQKAQTRLNNALGGFDKAMRPRVKLREATGWDRVIRPIEKELKRAEDELERLLRKQKAGEYVDPDYLKQLQATAKSLKTELADFRATKATGEMPPLPKSYKMKWAEVEKTTPDELLGDITDFLSKRKAPPGIQQPLPLVPRVGRTTIAVAEKVKPKVKAPPKVSKLRLEPTYKPVVKPEPAKVKVPSVFPSIKPKPKIYVKPEPTELVGITAAEWSRMPVAAREKALRDIEEAAFEAIVIPATRGLTKAQQIAAVQAATRIAIRNATRAIIQGATKAQIETQVKAAVQPLTKVVPKTRIKPLVKTIVKTTTKLTPKVKPRPRIIPRIWIPLPDSTSRLLTESETIGIIAWKQGFMYKMIYPPYGTKNIVNSRKPLAGVKYYKGAGSAAKSIIAKGGVVPKVLLRDMGIMDIKFVTPKGGRKPKIHFKRDIRQRTTVTPSITTMR